MASKTLFLTSFFYLLSSIVLINIFDCCLSGVITVGDYDRAENLLFLEDFIFSL